MEDIDDLKDIEEEGDENYYEEEFGELLEDNNVEDVAVFVKSKKGKTILQFNDYRYCKGYRSKIGTRWNCSSKRVCAAHVYLNGNDEIILTKDEHCHPPPRKTDVADSDKDTAVVITSRKGKEMLLFHQYTYRKQYHKGDRTRWICSTQKNCHANVFTDCDNFIITVYENHNHEPPKYYLNPDHVLEALRQPLVLETD